jgi:hypothetical protein
MRKRYLSVTIDSLTETDNFHEALGFGMSNTAISQFCVLDQQTGECITRFYSHRRRQLEVVQPLSKGDSVRFVVENAAKECGVEIKFVEHFTDEPKLLPRSQYEGIMDDFGDM